MAVNHDGRGRVVAETTGGVSGQCATAVTAPLATLAMWFL